MFPRSLPETLTSALLAIGMPNSISQSHAVPNPFPRLPIPYQHIHSIATTQSHTQCKLVATVARPRFSLKAKCMGERRNVQ